jgi:hypothetical protein
LLRQRIKGASRSSSHVLQQQQQAADDADMASMPFCMPVRIGPSTSQNRSSSAEATTVKTSSSTTPTAGYQLNRTSAQPTNSIAWPTQKVIRGKGALKLVRRLTWSSM